MKICVNCGTSFPNRVIIDGKQRNLKSRKYCLICSPFGEHNTINFNVNIQQKGENGRYCSWHTCKKPLTGNQTKFCSKNCNLKAAVTERRRKLKKMSIEYLGGQCQVCGYNACVAALEFHHTHGRDFGIAASGHTKSWSKVKKELERCILLCSNCHRETHWGKETVGSGIEPL